MADKYENFKKLQEHETGNFEIECLNRSSCIALISPHGGKIESKTTEIAKLIAEDSFNYYSFIGKRKKNNYKFLHITSTNFDEPRALKLVENSEIVITIHGCKDTQKDKQKKKINYGKKIFIGGLDEGLIVKLQDALQEASLPIFSLDTCSDFPSHFKGKKSSNICNKGTTKKGVQLELTKSFRDDGVSCGKFISAVSACLKTL